MSQDKLEIAIEKLLLKDMLLLKKIDSNDGIGMAIYSGKILAYNHIIRLINSGVYYDDYIEIKK